MNALAQAKRVWANLLALGGRRLAALALVGVTQARWGWVERLAGRPLPDPTLELLDWGPLADAPALILADRIMDHGALNRRIGQLAAMLASRLAPGDRVASWLPKDELACLLPLATARAGLVHVPVNPVLKRAQVAHILADSGAALLIANPARLDTLAPGDCAADTLTDGEVLGLMEAAAPLPASDWPTETLAALFYTSGSTGQPKGIMLSHANLWLGAVAVAHYLRLSSDDRVLAVLPLAFDYGQNQLLSAWAAGAAVVPHEYLLARDVVRAVLRHGATTLAGVPALWRQLLRCDWPEARLKRLTNSGGALDEPLVRALRAQFPAAEIHAMYGLTEAFRSTSLDPALIVSLERVTPSPAIATTRPCWRSRSTIAALSCGRISASTSCNSRSTSSIQHGPTRCSTRSPPTCGAQPRPTA